MPFPIERILALCITGAAGIVSILVYRRRDGAVPVRDTKSVPSCPAASLTNRLVRPLVAVVIVTSFVYSGPWQLPFHDSPIVRWIGAIASAVAVGLLVWAFRSLNDEYNPCTRAYLPQKIVTSGPYKWLRHPIYAANLLFLTGVMMSTGSLWVLLPLIAFSILYLAQSRREESALAAEFPEYQAYQQRTRWLNRS